MTRVLSSWFNIFKAVREKPMPSDFDEFQTELDTLPSAIYTAEYKRSLLAKLIYLIDHVADDHKNSLILSKIKNLDYKNFNLARISNGECTLNFNPSKSLEGAPYFREFLGQLNIIELEWLLASLKPGLAHNTTNNPQTAATFNYVYHDIPVPKPELIIERLHKATGAIFSDSLEAEAMRQHLEAVTKNPTQALEEHEYKQCGKPLDLALKFFLPKLGNEKDQTRAQFNRIIRKILKDPKISTYEQQRRLRFTVNKLADVLEQRGQLQHAFDLREAVFGREYALKRKHEYYEKKQAKRKEKEKAINKKQNQIRANRFFSSRQFLNNLLEGIRKITRLKPLNPTPPTKLIKTQELEPELDLEQQNPNKPSLEQLNKMQELYKSFAKMQQEATPEPNREIQPAPQPLVPGYANRYKQPTATQMFSENTSAHSYHNQNSRKLRPGPA